MAHQHHTHASPLGRGDHGLLLSHRRCLRTAQSSRPPLRVPQEALRLGGHHASCPLPTASWGGKRTLVLAGRPAVLLAPLPRGRRPLAFLAAPQDSQAQALPGALAAGCGGRTGRRPRDADRRLKSLLSVLHPRQVGQSAGFDGAAWVRWGSFSVYGVKLHLLCATNRVPLSYELTAANVAEARSTRELVEAADLGRALRAGFSGTWSTAVGTGGGTARGRCALGNRALPARWQKAAGGDRFGEPQAGVPPRRNVGDHPRGARHQDRGEDHAYPYGFLLNRLLGRPQGRIKELWA